MVGCGAWECPVCGPRKARLYAEAVAWGEPTTFGRLSLMPDTFEASRRQMKNLRDRLTVKYGTVEWAWVRHRNPALTGYHVHFVGRMPWIPQRELQGMTGGRIPWIAKARQGLGSSDYLLGVRERRGAAGYLLKRVSKEFYAEHLALNGGRGVHWSRGYFGVPVADVLWELRRGRSLAAGSMWYHPGTPQAVDWRKPPPSIPERVVVPVAERVYDSPQLFERG